MVGPRIGCAARKYRHRSYNISMPIPSEIHGQRYISLATFRKTGVSVLTPIWFTEESGKLFVMCSGKSGKAKRIRNNPTRQDRSLHHSWQNHRARVSSYGAHPPPGRRLPCPSHHQREVPSRPHSLPLSQHRHLHRDHSSGLNCTRAGAQSTAPRSLARYGKRTALAIRVAAIIYAPSFPLLPSKVVLALLVSHDSAFKISCSEAPWL